MNLESSSILGLRKMRKQAPGQNDGKKVTIQGSPCQHQSKTVGNCQPKTKPHLWEMNPNDPAHPPDLKNRIIKAIKGRRYREEKKKMDLGKENEESDHEPPRSKQTSEKEIVSVPGQLMKDKIEELKRLQINKKNKLLKIHMYKFIVKQDVMWSEGAYHFRGVDKFKQSHPSVALMNLVDQL